MTLKILSEQVTDLLFPQFLRIFFDFSLERQNTPEEIDGLVKTLQIHHCREDFFHFGYKDTSGEDGMLGTDINSFALLQVFAEPVDFDFEIRKSIRSDINERDTDPFLYPLKQIGQVNAIVVQFRENLMKRLGDAGDLVQILVDSQPSLFIVQFQHGKVGFRILMRLLDENQIVLCLPHLAQ